jgi:DNA-binding CsgD family transcriptional regulator
MRNESDLFERLLDKIYDAATDDQLWAPIFREISTLTNSVGGVLLGQSQSPRLLHFARHYNTDPECLRVLRDRHVLNPWTLHMQKFHPSGTVVLSDSILPLTELRRTAFFDEVMRPQDLGHAAMVGLSRKPDFGVGFCLNRGPRQGPYSEQQRYLLERLTPHLMRTVQLGFQLGTYKALQHVEYNTLDRITVGVGLLDRNAGVLFVNKALRSMAIDGALSLRNQRLSSYSAPHAKRLNGLVHSASRGAPGATMAIPHPIDGRSVAVLVSSVRSRDLDRFASLDMRDAAAMVFVLDPAISTMMPPEWVMDAYGLTLAEARVALHVASGRSVADVGAQLKISPNTVKTHLRRVFAKTGVHRQAELASIIASLKLMTGAVGTT